MKENVIYFPYIRVPQDEWFTRILLYWDQIGSIVPMDYVDDPSKLGKYMHNLVQEGLVNQIIPGQYVYEIPNFTEAFLEYVDNPNYPVLQGVIARKRVPTIPVHMEKLGSIGNELCQRGLARQRDSRWYDIEAYTANQFMAYLAASLGKLPEIESEPITDNTQNLASFAPQYHQGGKLRAGVDEMRTLVLKDILPAPSGGINPRKLAKFKDDYKNELIHFRNRVESFLISAAAIKDSSLRSESIKRFVIETRDDVNELSELMKSKGWKNITLGWFLAIPTSAFGLTSAITTGELFGVVAAAFGIGSAFYATIREAMSADDVLEGKYAAYAVLAQKKLRWIPRLI
jgi:hypothetical protein